MNTFSLGGSGSRPKMHARNNIREMKKGILNE
jgi:hypothetical protein